MSELPQQPPDCHAILPIEEENGNGIIHDDIEFQILEPPIPPMMKLEEKDLFLMARFLQSKYEKGFTWGELPLIIEQTRAFVGPNPEMSAKEKLKSCIEIIHYLMVGLDTLYLPEKATDPFFEHLIAPYIELALAFPTERALIQSSFEKELTEEALTEYASQILKRFDDGCLTWKNLSLMTRYALIYVLSYKNLSPETQAEGALAIIEVILSQTSPSRLPDFYDEKLYKTFLKNFIALQLPI